MEECASHIAYTYVLEQIDEEKIQEGERPWKE
jgi:hypothetical protein